LNPSSGGVYRFAGTSTGGEDWSLILKVTRSPESLDHGRPLPDELARTLRSAVRWDRELLAYETGFLDSLDGRLTAARCHGWTRHDDETAWLWLEDLSGSFSGAWTIDRWREVARALGAFNATASAGGHEWLGRGWLRTWTTKLTPFHFGSAFEDGPHWDESAYPPEVRARLARLWRARDALLGAVESLAPVCSHLDGHRRNLLVDGERVVAIDWGLVGLAAPGEEIASTLVGTVASGEAPAEQADELAEELFAGYLLGLREGGWDGADDDARLGFATAAGLRVFSVLGLGSSAETLQRCATLSRCLLRLGEEALERRA
jgi:hypothetical protein